MRFDHPVRQPVLWLSFLFLLVSIAEHPRTTGQELGPFLGRVGHFFTELVVKFGQVLTGLGHG
jgi:hypothetical protein